MTTFKTFLVLLGATLFTSSVSAGTVDGTLKLGGIIMNQEGDRSTVQETYNIYDGFSVTQLLLNGTAAPNDYFTLDLQEINLDSRKGSFIYRRPGIFKVTAGYDQHRQVFSPDARVESQRKDFKLGAQYAPMKWLRFSGSYNYLRRDGDRLAYPVGTMSALGTEYDNALQLGQVTAEVHRGRKGGALTFQVSDLSNKIDSAVDRSGQVISARLYGPCYFYDKWTHMLRGSYGVRKLSDNDIEYKISTFQYTGVVAPVSEFEFKYGFDASRVDDQATDLKTDRFQNDFDATFFYPFGQVSAGYGYEINDDDNALTHYHSWRAGTVFRYHKYVTARVNYAGRNKKDEEELTLLKDVESFQFRARLQVQPVEGVDVGGGYGRREREFPDIHVKSVGDGANGFVHLAYAGWGSVSGDYNYAADTYTDLYAGFDVKTHIATGRVDFERIANLRLGGGVTYLDVRRDLDIEKSMVFAEGAYRLQDDYYVEVKYNVYNYDDYILLDRYYTANVWRINVGYDFNLK